MAEFTVSAKLVADASRMKAGIKEGEDALVRLTAAEYRALQGIEGFARGTNGLRAPIDNAKQSAEGLTRALQQITIAARAQEQAARRQQQSMRGLGIQMGDLGQSLALGINPAIAMGQQMGQLAGAAEGLGGRMGRLAAFLSTPWGAAIQTATIVLGLLISGLFRGKEASDDLTRSKTLQEMTTRELIRAINDENEALQRSIQTGRQAEMQALATAQAKRTEALRRIDAAEAALREARAMEEQGRLSRGELGAEVGQGMAMSRAQTLEAELRQARASLEAAERLVTSAGTPLARRAADARNDQSRRIQEDYDAAVERATAQLNFDTEPTNPLRRNRDEAQRRYNDALDRAILERNRATEALQGERREQTRAAAEERRAQRRATQDAERTRDQLYREARARAAALGATVTSGFRTRAENDAADGAQNSFHLSKQALDLRLQPGLTRDRLRQAFAGFNITELLGPGDPGHADHWHIAWRGAAEGIGEAADALAEDLRALAGDFDAITRQFDPATAGANEYAQALARIQRLSDAGMLSPDQVEEFSRQALLNRFEADQRRVREEWQATVSQMSGDWQKAFDLSQPILEASDNLSEGLQRAGRDGARAFRDEGIEAAQAIAQIFGGKIGGALGPILGLLAGSQTGNFNSVGGGLGGLLTLFGRSGGGRLPPLVIGGEEIATPAIPVDDFLSGLQDVFDPIRRGLRELLSEISGIFGDQGAFTKALGKAGGFAMLGGGVSRALGGSTLAGSLGGVLGGFGAQQLGGLFGKSLGSFGSLLGPLGSIAGGILGSVVGKMITGTKRGSATITGIDSAIGTRGNSSAFRGQASGVAGSVQQALAQIAEQLGGGVGNFAVSIGLRDGKFRVDPTGQGRTKTKKGAVDFGEDEAAAISFAIMDAIKDGAVTGLSAAVQQALRSSGDLDRAMKEALKVQQIEDLLSDLGGTMGRQFREFERQAADRVRIARQYGFDVVKIEEINAKERLKLTEDILASRIGSLRELLNDLSFGDLFEGSLSDRRSKLLEEIAKVRPDADAGVEGAADKLADLSRNLIELSREAFGTAGGEFAADRQLAISSAERVIELENERLRIAQDATRETNTQLNEANDHLSEHSTLLRQIAGALSGSSGAAALGGSSSITTRQTSLR